MMSNYLIQQTEKFKLTGFLSWEPVGEQQPGVKRIILANIGNLKNCPKTGREKVFENFDKFSNVITTMVKKIEEPTSPHWRGKW